MKSKTKISKQAKRKTSEEIMGIIKLAKKNPKWLQVAGILSGPTRKYASVNLNKIDKNSKEGDTIIVIGKVLSQGELTKKVRIAALGFSEEAISKIKKAKCEAKSIEDEIKLDPQARGIKIIK